MIRDATLDDIKLITDIYHPAVTKGLASFEYDPPDAIEMARRFEALKAQEMPYLVYELNGDVAGYAYAGRYRTRPGYRWTVEDSVYVNETHQGKGIGKTLLLELLSQCERLGFRQMIAIIGDSNNLGSVKLHEACGFSLIGVEKNVGLKLGQWVDCVMMQRSLGEGSNSLPVETVYPGTLR